MTNNKIEHTDGPASALRRPRKSVLLPGDPDPETPPDAPGPPPGQFVTDPQTVAAIQRIQAITQGQGSTDPIYLLGQAHVRIAQLQESLAVAIQELTRLGTK